MELPKFKNAQLRAGSKTLMRKPSIEVENQNHRNERHAWPLKREEAQPYYDVELLRIFDFKVGTVTLYSDCTLARDMW